VNKIEFLNESKEINNTNFLNESKESHILNILNESKEIINTKFLNESKESDVINIPNESKESDKDCILYESKDSDAVRNLNESKESDKDCILNESKDSDTVRNLNESKEYNNINIQNDSMEKRFDLKQPIESNECISKIIQGRRNRYILNAHTIFSDISSSFEEIQSRIDKSLWEAAIKSELDAHQFNNTWSIVRKPENINIVDSKWVFTLKSDEFGNPKRYKARLVARGFTQKYLIDYEETFAPVARIASFRFLLSVSIQYDLKVHHMDVKSAFLNGKLKEEIYMIVPQGVLCSANSV